MEIMRVLVGIFIVFIASLAHAESFALPLKGQELLTQKAITAGQQKKNGLVVVFLSAKCPCSDSHGEELATLFRDFSDFEFVGIHSNMDEPADVSKAYFERKALPFPILQDAGAKIADDLKAYKTPHAFVLNPSGEILYQGGVTDSAKYDRANRKYLREALEDLRAHKSVRTPEGRTLGCVISRSP